MTSGMGREAMKQKRARVKALVEAGRSDEEIAPLLGLSKGRISSLRRELRILKRPHNSLPVEVIAEIKRLHEVEEWPPGEIAATLGLSYAGVYSHTGATKTGAEWNKVARWAASKHRKLWEELRS